MLGEFGLEEQEWHQRGGRDDPADADLDRLGRCRLHRAPRASGRGQQDAQAKGAHRILPMTIFIFAKASIGQWPEKTALDWLA